MIEQVLIKKTLKAGDTIWVEGSIENSPLSQVLLDEVRLGTGTVEVIKQGRSESPEKLTFVAQKVEEKAGVTSTSAVQTESGSAVVKDLKPKPILKRRKR